MSDEIGVMVVQPDLLGRLSIGIDGAFDLMGAFTAGEDLPLVASVEAGVRAAPRESHELAAPRTCRKIVGAKPSFGVLLLKKHPSPSASESVIAAISESLRIQPVKGYVAGDNKLGHLPRRF
jgi:hypothetical protein